MSLLERLEVPDAKSWDSIRATFKPRDAASSAAPTPVTPPPITNMSKDSLDNSEMALSRCWGLSCDRNISVDSPLHLSRVSLT